MPLVARSSPNAREVNPVSCFFILASDRNYFPYACLAALRALELSAGPIVGFILHVGTTEEDRHNAHEMLGERVRGLF